MSGAPSLALLLAIPLLGEIPTLLSILGVIIVTLGILVTLGPNLLKSSISNISKSNKNIKS